ncbi:MAG: NUDIX domain-containing protein [Bacteroidota bacterium]|nr:NUDIX domain-containing protein [Bacteroidota bacterium]MDP3144635.1 NUDIX domain-containing protein [Bacteroidota bacterium]
MNKKIYYNNKILEFPESETQSSQNQTIKIYDEENKQTLKIIIDDFLDQTNQNSFQILNYDFETTLAFLKNNFSFIEAAGGFIEKENQYLFIHRLGKWDLPKGKLEKGEAIENAAIRECEEECGVTNLKITKKLSSTFHIYPYKKGFAIKQTYWFYMITNHAEILKPQIEENIDEARWFSENELKITVLNDTYLTIKDVIIEALDPMNTDKLKI